MPKGNNKGNGAAAGISKSVFLYTIGDVASVLRLPFDETTPDTFVLGEGYTLVRTSADVVKAISEAILEKYGYTDEDKFTHALRLGRIAQKVREQVKDVKPFNTTDIPLDLPDLTKGKPGKGKKVGPVDEEDDDDEDEVTPVEVPVQPWQA